jgi:hypothetical protein
MEAKAGKKKVGQETPFSVVSLIPKRTAIWKVNRFRGSASQAREFGKARTVFGDSRTRLVMFCESPKLLFRQV